MTVIVEGQSVFGILREGGSKGAIFCADGVGKVGVICLIDVAIVLTRPNIEMVML